MLHGAIVALVGNTQKVIFRNRDREIGKDLVKRLELSGPRLMLVHHRQPTTKKTQSSLSKLT